jgi:hypothetical protein
MKRGTIRKLIATRAGLRTIAVEKRQIEARCPIKAPEPEASVIAIGPIAAEVAYALRNQIRFPRAWWEM